MDLLLPEVPRKSSIRPADNPKLEIKRDTKGLVSVLGATQQAVTSAEQLMATVEQVRQAHSCCLRSTHACMLCAAGSVARLRACRSCKHPHMCFSFHGASTHVC